MFYAKISDLIRKLSLITLCRLCRLSDERDEIEPIKPFVGLLSQAHKMNIFIAVNNNSILVLAHVTGSLAVISLVRSIEWIVTETISRPDVASELFLFFDYFKIANNKIN